MPEHTTPGVSVEEGLSRLRSIEGVPTGAAGFVGGGRGSSKAQLVTSAVEFDRLYGAGRSLLGGAVHGFFANGGKRLWIAPTLAALAAVDEISLVASPGSRVAAKALVRHAETHGRFALVDGAAKGSVADLLALRARIRSPWAAVHHPWVETPLGQRLPPSGFVAGVYARNDAERGVWKAPANQVVRGVTGVAAVKDPAGLAAQGINLIREVQPGTIVLWGARTTSDDPDWKYVNVRRYLAFLERSIEQGTQWTVFEPNGEPLRQKLRTAIESFLTVQWRAGALQGVTPAEAFFVRCDASTNTQADVDAGRLNCVVGAAVVKAAEFVVIRIAAAAAA